MSNVVLEYCVCKHSDAIRYDKYSDQIYCGDCGGVRANPLDPLEEEEDE